MYTAYTFKGQLISKCLFGVLNFFQNTNENKSTWVIMIVKSNFFIHFLEELRIPTSPYEINWPLLIQKYFFVLQRISLARALYAVLNDQKTEKAEFVVLLDDPLSAVDPSVSD